MKVPLLATLALAGCGGVRGPTAAPASTPSSGVSSAPLGAPGASGASSGQAVSSTPALQRPAPSPPSGPFPGGLLNSGHIRWQYGRTDVAGSGVGYLSTPDGLDPLPVGAVPGT